jgi:hypothetical protein
MEAPVGGVGDSNDNALAGRSIASTRRRSSIDAGRGSPLIDPLMRVDAHLVITWAAPPDGSADG